MSQPRLEVADIFCAHGAAYRAANAGHISLDQLKVMRATIDTFLHPLRKIDRVVYAKGPFAGPNAVLAYLSCAPHRIAISNSRLIRFDERNVTFRDKDYRISGPERHTTMT